MAREHSMGQVVPLRPHQQMALLHPSMMPTERTVLFDQDNLDRSEDRVVLTQLQGQLIASLIDRLRMHAPSQRFCEDAIELLTTPTGASVEVSSCS